MQQTEETGELNEFLATLSDFDGIDESDIAELKKVIDGQDPVGVPQELLNDDSSSEEKKKALLMKAEQGALTEDEVTDVRAVITDLKVPGKMKLGMFGNSICRFLLIVDANKAVQACVLKNPKLGEGEIETFAKNPNVSEFVLRTISNTRTWMKSYQIKHNLATNPKTPGGVALKWLRYLRKSDLRIISKSKNLPQIVAVNAKKMLAAMDKR